MQMRAARFCLNCGTPLQTQELAGRARQVCPQCHWIWYRNPVPVAAALVERDGEILLLKRRNEPLRGFWAPPTGYVEWDESAAQAAVRETLEETGFEIQLTSGARVYSRANVGILFIAYRAQIVGGREKLSDEADELAFCAPRNFPPQPATHADTPLDQFFLDALHEMTNSLFQRES